MWFLTWRSLCTIKNLLKWINWCIKIQNTLKWAKSFWTKKCVWADIKKTKLHYRLISRWQTVRSSEIHLFLTVFNELCTCLTRRAVKLNSPVSLSLTAPWSHHPCPDYWNPGLSSWVLPPAHRLLRLQGLPRLFLWWHPWLWWLSDRDVLSACWCDRDLNLVFLPLMSATSQWLDRLFFFFFFHRLRRWF